MYIYAIHYNKHNLNIMVTLCLEINVAHSGRPRSRRPHFINFPTEEDLIGDVTGIALIHVIHFTFKDIHAERCVLSRPSIWTGNMPGLDIM